MQSGIYQRQFLSPDVPLSWSHSGDLWCFQLNEAFVIPAKLKVKPNTYEELKRFVNE